MPPKIPTIEGRNIPQSRAGTPSFRAVEAPNTYAGAGIRAADMASTAGEGLKNIGTEIGAVVKEREDKEAAFQAASAKTQFLRDTLEMESALDQDPDYPNYQNKFSAAAEQSRQRYAASIRDPNARRQFLLETEEDVVRGQYRMREKARAKQIDAGRAAFTSNYETNKEIAISAPDELTSVAAMKANRANADAAYEAGYITAEEYQKSIADFKKEFALGRISLLPLEEQQRVLSQKFEGAEAVNADYVSVLTAIESGGDPNAKNPMSSAKGLYQWTDATARQYGLLGENFDYRGDAEMEAAALKEFTEDNRQSLSIMLGRQPTDAELYLAHQQGAEGAAKLLSNPSARAIDIVGVDAVRNNGGSELMTAGAFANKWINKYGQLAGSVAADSRRTGTVVDFVPATVAREALDRVENKIQTEMPKRLFETYKFADQQQLGTLRNMATMNDAAAKAYADIQKAKMDDPAAFAAGAPEVQMAGLSYQQNPTPETAAGYLTALRDKQLSMGVPDNQTRYMAKSETEQLKTALDSETITSTKLLEMVDGIGAKYSPVKSRVLAEMQTDGVKAPVIELLAMDTDARRNDLADAIIIGEETMLKTLPDKSLKKQDIDSEITKEMQEFSLAMNLIDMGPAYTAQKADAFRLLTLRYLNDGMSLTDALASAKDAVIPFEIDDSLILPKGTPVAEVRMAVDDVMSNMEDILVFATESGVDEVTDAVTRQTVMKQIKPVVNGNKIYFLGPNRNYLIDKTKLEYIPGTDTPINIEDAALSLDISEALEYSQSVVAEAGESVGNLRAVVSQSIGDDVNARYFRYDSPPINGVKRTPAPPILMKESIAQMEPQQREMTLKKIRENHAYVNAVMQRIPENQREAFKKYIQKSNEISVMAANVMSKTDDYGAASLSGKARKELRKSLPKGYMRGPGYNYLELPEWAK